MILYGEDRFTPQKVAMALSQLIRTQYPRLVVAGPLHDSAEEVRLAARPRESRPYYTNTREGLRWRNASATPAQGHEAIVMITDGKPAP